MSPRRFSRSVEEAVLFGVPFDTDQTSAEAARMLRDKVAAGRKPAEKLPFASSAGWFSNGAGRDINAILHGHLFVSGRCSSFSLPVQSPRLSRHSWRHYALLVWFAKIAMAYTSHPHCPSSQGCLHPP